MGAIHNCIMKNIFSQYYHSPFAAELKPVNKTCGINVIECQGKMREWRSKTPTRSHIEIVFLIRNGYFLK